MRRVVISGAQAIGLQLALGLPQASGGSLHALRKGAAAFEAVGSAGARPRQKIPTIARMMVDQTGPVEGKTVEALDVLQELIYEQTLY